MHDLEDWRCPQVVIPEIRRASWPNSLEISINVDSSKGLAAPDSQYRILVVLESYDTHRYATPDGDPWNLDRIHPPSNESADYPCRLPKPPELMKRPLEELERKLPACFQDHGSSLYYLPPEDWNYATVTKERWRDRGHGFPYRSDSTPHCSGWIDKEDRIWEWDREERHWDVQSRTTYLRVSHTGTKLSSAIPHSTRCPHFSR